MNVVTYIIPQIYLGALSQALVTGPEGKYSILPTFTLSGPPRTKKTHPILIPKKSSPKCPSCGQPLRRWARGLYAVKLVLVLVLVLVAGWFLLSTALDMHHAAEGPINITVRGK